jgi:hypothetical protein
MRGLGILLAGIGALVALIGFGLEPQGAAGTVFERVASLSLANERLILKLMLAVIGSALFTSGIVVMASAHLGEKLAAFAAGAAGEERPAPRRKAA